ncbi:uncharacterized protein LOC143550383 [Bidens hawaiensis]|uniref:uncharacterized protein LOC143550383 n=1 Tax=Bidens hawaiensis TaxID=980011 RepID=UPI00404A8454
MAGENSSGDVHAKPDPKTLHPVYSVTNIQNKIRVLDGEEVTYSCWTKLFKLHAKGYKVSHHIDGTPPPAVTDATYESWAEVDAIVLQWIYKTITNKILARVLVADPIAQEAWNKIREIFLNNMEARAQLIEHKFTNLTLAACLSLDDYFQQLKDLANQLEDVEKPVDESRLVMQMIKGLPSEYNIAVATINQGPNTWDQA